MAEELYDILGEDEMFLIEDAELASQLSDSDLASIQEVANRHLKINSQIEQVEELLTKLKEANKVLTDDKLPKLLMKAGVSSFTLVTGEKIEVSHIVQANMPKAETDEFPKAVAWLETAGIGDIVKKDVIAKFGRGDGELAKRAMEAIMRETNGQVPVEIKESVNYMTLNSVLKQRMTKGESLPSSEDGMTVYVGPRAKIKKAKK